jgi:cytochrome c biogenesis factor
MKLSCRGENIANAILKPVLLSGGVLICARYAYVAACNNHYNIVAFIVIALLALVLYFLLLIIFMKNEFGKIVNSVKMNKKQEKTL